MLYYQNDFLFSPPDIDKGSVNLCLTAPPLSALAVHQLPLLFSRLKPIMAKNGCVLVETPYPNQLDMHNSSIFKYQRVHVYEDTGFVSAHGYGHQREVHVFATGDFLRSPDFKQPLDAPRNREPSHRCEWCPDIVQLLIATYSEKADTVLDCFCGTGTVPGEADRMDRNGIGIDVRPFENLLDGYQVMVENYD